MVLTKQQRKKKNKKEKGTDSESSGDEESIQETTEKIEKLVLQDNSKVLTKLVITCPYCKIPSEYCEFKEEWGKCKEWMEKNAQQVLQAIQAAREQDILNNKTTKTLKVKKEKEEKKENRHVTISISRRGKKKTATVIVGLDAYGVDPKKACTYLKKRFACGASEQIDTLTNLPAIEVQGDIRDDIGDILEGEYKVPPKFITYIEEKKKKKDEQNSEDSDDSDDEPKKAKKVTKSVKSEKTVEKKPEKVGEKKPSEKPTGEKPKKSKKDESESESDDEDGPLNQKKEKSTQKYGAKKEIVYAEKKKVDFGPKVKAKEPKVCAFFNSERGCKEGDKCVFAHIKGKSGEMPKKPCQFFGTEKGCPKGDTCAFSHIKK